MKKVLLAIVLPMIFILSGCLSDPVQEDILNYVNKEMKKAYDLETVALDAYDSVTGANYTNDAIMYNVLLDEVIPYYTEFLDEIERVNIETKELKEVHDDYVTGATYQYNAFVKLVGALEQQDRAMVEEANALLAKARQYINTYNKNLDKLAKEHDVEWE
ncbi:hypothetical protein LCL95_17025 [Bacillus timonensis]|nr:hypothetical protein [Bacillus timonensis]